MFEYFGIQLRAKKNRLGITIAGNVNFLEGARAHLLLLFVFGFVVVVANNLELCAATKKKYWKPPETARKQQHVLFVKNIQYNRYFQLNYIYVCEYHWPRLCALFLFGVDLLYFVMTRIYFGLVADMCAGVKKMFLKWISRPIQWRYFLNQVNKKIWYLLFKNVCEIMNSLL